MGDVLLLRRAVASLRAAGHGIGLLAPAASGAALVGPGPSEVDRLIAWDRSEVAALLTEEGPAAGPLRDKLAAFDAAVAYTRSAPLLRNLARLILRVVAHDPQPGALETPEASGPRGPWGVVSNTPPATSHASVWLTLPLRELGVEASLAPPPHRPTEAESAAARDLMARLPEGFLAIHPGSGSPAKNWPPERFAALVAARSAGRPWLLVEGLADAQAVAPLQRRPGAVLARHLPARVLGAVLAQAGAYVGNDSGVSHLADAWGAPTVALYGPTDPTVWAPVGRDVRVVRSETGRMEGIAVEQVLAALTTSSAPGPPSD